MAPAPQHARPAKGVTAAVLADIEARLASLPFEDLERLARRCFSRSALRTRRLAERDRAIRELASRLMPGLLAAGGELTKARLEHAAMKRLRSYGAAWPRERAKPMPDDPERALLYRIYQLNGGKAPKDIGRIVSKV